MTQFSLPSTLLPWVLAGALLASVYANFAMNPSDGAAKAGYPDASAGTSPSEQGGIPAYHLAPGNSGESCPTLDKLKLNSEQRNQIRKCSLTSLDQRTRLALEITAASEELHTLLARDDVENTLVLELADQISELRSKQFKAWIGSILVVREVLSPEQRKQLRALESNQ